MHDVLLEQSLSSDFFIRIYFKGSKKHALFYTDIYVCHLGVDSEYIEKVLYSFLAPLAKGQRAFVMALCPSCIHSFVHACVHKLFLQKTSQKLLTGFLRNFTEMILRWSSFKFLQIIVFYEEFWLPWQSK